jgi:hypothetical protein
VEQQEEKVTLADIPTVGVYIHVQGRDIERCHL